MKKRRKISIPPKYILIFLTVVCSGLIIISLVDNEALLPVQNGISKVITPIHKGLNQVGLWFSDKAETLKEITQLKEENDRLKAELDSLKTESNFTANMKSELDSLRKLYELDSLYDDYPKVAARVIHSNSSNWFSEFTINKGRNDGIEVDMNVIAGSGLVGRISFVADDYAKVTTIINDDHNVSAKFAESSENCIVSGDLTLKEKNLIRVSGISIDANVSEGDKLVTSYISDKYVPGLLIGYISSVENDSNNMTKSGYVTPVVDFSSIEEVLVITQQKETGAQE